MRSLLLRRSLQSLESGDSFVLRDVGSGPDDRRAQACALTGKSPAHPQDFNRVSLHRLIKDSICPNYLLSPNKRDLSIRHPAPSGTVQPMPKLGRDKTARSGKAMPRPVIADNDLVLVKRPLPSSAMTELQ